MKRYELSGLSQTNGLIHISSKDEQTFQKLLPNIPQLTVSLALNDTNFVAPKADFNVNEWGFLGAMNWQPNEQAIETLKKRYFLRCRRNFHKLNYLSQVLEQTNLRLHIPTVRFWEQLQIWAIFTIKFQFF